MSTGLLFHYFASKEELLLELVKLGVQSTQSTEKMADIPPELYFEGFLTKLFEYAKEQPWVFNMFVLMGQARRAGMPEEARKRPIPRGSSPSSRNEREPCGAATCNSVIAKASVTAGAFLLQKHLQAN